MDRFLALSLRKLLCDKESILKAVCPNFKMPPLSGRLFECPGDDNDMRLYEMNPDIRIKPQNEWVLVDDWLEEKIAWIDKGVDDIPKSYTDSFFHMIADRVGNDAFAQFFESEVEKDNGKSSVIWKLKDPDKNKAIIYEILNNKGYYDLTIRRMIKHIADKKGAHLDAIDSTWINLANQSVNYKNTAMSVFSTHMIYAATKQVQELQDYLEINPMLETL